MITGRSEVERIQRQSSSPSVPGSITSRTTRSGSARSIAERAVGPSAASSVVFGETFGPLRLAGMVTVVGGIAVMLLPKRPKALEKQVLPKIA